MFAATLLLALNFAAAAQVHPCDAVLAVNPALNSPVVGGFCHDSTLPITSQLYVDGAMVWTGVPTLVVGPNAQGYAYYESPQVAVAKGAHKGTVIVINADGTSVVSDPFDFSVKGVGKPIKVRFRSGG